jgi:hypothetical protein
VANNHKKEKTNNLFTDESKWYNYKRQSEIQGFSQVKDKI